MACFVDLLRQRKLPQVLHVIWIARILSGARITLYATLCALALTLSCTTVSYVSVARAGGNHVVLSTPLALTSLGLKVTPSVLLDNQGYFHLLYQTDASQNQVNLEYKVVKSNGQSIQQIGKTVTLVRAADNIDSAVLVVDSRSRLHAAWIEIRNGTFFVRDALVENSVNNGVRGIDVPTTLYQDSNPAYGVSAGADGSGNVFYGWLDSSTGAPNLKTIEIHDDQSVGQPVQLTQQTDQLDFLHLIVYPDDTLVGVMLHQSSQGTWDLTIYPFDATGKSLHAPIVAVPSLHPGPANQAGKDTNTFHTDPMAVTLDAQQHLHIAWGQVLQLGYIDAGMQPDHDFLFQPKTLRSAAYDNQNLCLSAGPAYPGSTTLTAPSPLWLGWLDTSEVSTLHPYIAQISEQGTLVSTPTSLVDANTLAAVPCVEQDGHGGLFVTWTQYSDNGGYVLEMATTTVAPQTPFWVRLGLNYNDPIQQIVFIFLGSVLLGALGMLPNLVATPVAALVVRVGRWGHVPRLAVLLVGLGMLLAVDVWFQGFMAANFGAPGVPVAWIVVGGSLALVVLVLLWARRRQYPPETLGTIGQLLLASFAAAAVLAVPTLVVLSRS